MSCRRHKGSRFWQCRKCGCEKNVQGRCRICGLAFQASRKIKIKNNGYSQARTVKSETEKVLAPEARRPKESKNKINVRRMVKYYRKEFLANYLAALKNQAATA